MPSLPSRNKIFVVAFKYYTESVMKVFSFCPTLLEFFTLLQIFCPRLYFSKTYETLLEIYILKNKTSRKWRASSMVAGTGEDVKGKTYCPAGFSAKNDIPFITNTKEI